VLSSKEKVPAVLEVEASEIAFTKESSLLQLRVDDVHANKIKDKGYICKKAIIRTENNK
jgi:hypothetical protein